MSLWVGFVGSLVFIAMIILLFKAGGSSSTSKGQAEKEFLRLCRGDKEMMERLITFEQERTPGQSRDAATRAAMHSFKRDNR